ncbi:MAG: transglycosylase family protein [Acidimicrobiales bacterium]|nr:transglycosylase family protein [Acidimicrobiales bacterium]
MARNERRERAGLWAAAMTAVLALWIAPAAAQSTIVLGVDVASFSERATAWATASNERRAADLVRAEELGREAAEREAAEEAAAEALRVAITTTAPPSTTTTTTTTAAVASIESSTTTSPPPGGPTLEQWAALRNCESGGRYDAVSPSGRYRGAYQFSQATWDWVASFANPALAGVDPITASVADQDAHAQALYERQGARPWPHCGVYLLS